MELLKPTTVWYPVPLLGNRDIFFFSIFFRLENRKLLICHARYKIEEAGLVESSNKAGVLALFDKHVHQTQTKLQIGFNTFLTRVGGIIGVGKNLLWILIFSLSSLGLLFKLIKKGGESL